jgi:hypothetical protein
VDASRAGLVIEPAKSGRARCRGCGKPIEKDALRFGELVVSGYGDGETRLWFHLLCAAYKRPEPLAAALAGSPVPADEQARLRAAAELGVAHRRVPRIDGVERASSGRARCRQCREPIEQGALRVRLVFFEEVQFNPSGFVHASCAREYLGTGDVLDRLAHFGLPPTAEDLDELRRALADPTSAPRAPRPRAPA